MAYYVTPNVVNNGIYSGNCFAFGASGGFIVQQGFSEIQMRIPDLLNKYDVTNAIQVKFSARTLNNKIGILKDELNSRVVEAWFDPVNDKLGYDSLKICACEFVNGINIDSVVSVGRLQQLYSDFNTVVSNYFGDPGGFSSLFAGASEFDVNDGIFDASALIQIVNSSTFSMNGSFVSDLSGDVHIYDINNTLQHAIDANIFRNRNPATYNYGIIDGFIAGDLIFIPEGFTISLSLDIQAETLLPINNVGPSFLDSIRDKLNWTRGYVKRSTTWSTTNITQSTTLPILLLLSDVDLQNYTNYGLYWSIASNVIGDTEQRNDKWLAISLSANGKHQTVITEIGDIFISCDYGSNRNIVFNIGLAESNSISISFTGKYQTASNGHNIYISSDYGQTWNQTFSSGTSNIFVSISLTGQYQTVVSCGDNVYFSKDYGNTWRPMSTDTELYFSIEGFPTAGIALSYTGLYQTIVTENIYISNDYGETWRNIGADNDFGDRNWQAVAISSDGLYQSAIENGGDIYTSSDYGNTWTFVSDPNLNDLTWDSISLSATGQYQTALQQNGGIFISTDYGYSWTKVPDIDNKKWRMVSISSDALYQCAIEYSGYIYMSHILTSTNNGEPCKCDDDNGECY